MSATHQPPNLPETADAIVVGGGFYGCCLALYLRSVYDKVVVLEARDDLLTRASFVNQARIHTGFHYPRSFVTARRSLSLYERFMADFRPAVVDDFAMLYAVAKAGSRITPERFRKMYADMNAPIEQASKEETALFDPKTVGAVFRCQEFGFDAPVLAELLRARMKAAGISVYFGAEVSAFDLSGANVGVQLADGRRCGSAVVFDATYGQIAARGGPDAPQVQFKYELAEIALIDPPAELAGYGVTLMDGPFFSTMPFRARGCYSLTHVRYTPHRAWTSSDKNSAWPKALASRASTWKHMVRDAQRYLPSMGQAHWRGSLMEVKSVLMRNEADDGRPILLSRNAKHAGLMCVLGGKLDNIYDLFDALKTFGGPLGEAHTGYVTAEVAL